MGYSDLVNHVWFGFGFGAGEVRVWVTFGSMMFGSGMSSVQLKFGSGMFRVVYSTSV